ncbi:glutamine synthetase family protein [Streptomyces sp. 8N616]|uniref:glutamine synthetase family protein n=1 Tax=Streptomyces sp. 8N616 TaxID=3457414 RepID=UPI003FD666D9
MNSREVDQFLTENAIDTVELAIVDTMGALRGKRLPASAFRRGHEPEVCLSGAVFCLDYSLDLVHDDTYNWVTGYPDVFLRADFSTLRVVPWRPGTALVFCDVVDANGAMVPFHPRYVLRQAEEQCLADGLVPRVGLETEFYLLDRDTLRPRRDRIPVYSLHDNSYLDPVVTDVRAALETSGVEIEAFEAEYGPGQVEINLRYAGAVAAADNLMFFRYAAKEIAARHGYLATFMAKPLSDAAGSGLHVHQSLWSDDTGQNVFWDAGKGELSAAAKAYLAGLLSHCAETHLVAVPTPNGYKRTVAHSFAPTHLTWGIDNRSAAVRALVRDRDATRLEQRVATADANPYLTVATQLVAGLTGMTKQLELDPAVCSDANEPSGADPLPGHIEDAVARLRGSEFVRSVLGRELVEILCRLGMGETAAQNLEVSDWERSRYLEAV